MAERFGATSLRSSINGDFMGFAEDRLVFDPRDVELSRSPLAGHLKADTHVLGAFNPGLTRLPNGNLLMMVRVAEALSEPVRDEKVHAIRWTCDAEAHAGESSRPSTGHYVLDGYPLESVDLTDPRQFVLKGQPWRVLALTSLSWLLPVELTADGLSVVRVHYDRAIAPRAPYQSLGIEDPRISRVDGRYLMTTCSVSPERHCTTLYSSGDGLDWTLEGIVLDHQNKDMLIFEGLIGGKFWAQTRPLGDLYFAYPPDSEWRAGPSINLSTSPDALHWRPNEQPGIRPHAATLHTARMGGGAPPILTGEGWLSLWHGVEPGGDVGVYRTYWSLLDRDNPSRCIRTEHASLIEPNAMLTAPIEDLMYLRDVVFTTGIVDGGDHYIVASGEADLACRITHVAKNVFS